VTCPDVNCSRAWTVAQHPLRSSCASWPSRPHGNPCKRYPVMCAHTVDSQSSSCNSGI
jgi:hypothetical protein